MTLTHEQSKTHIVQDVDVKLIFSDPDFNCRQEKIVPFDVQELANDIKKCGLIQPVVIQPWDTVKPFKYRIVVGHRRYQAFLNLKRITIPAIIRTDLDESQARALNLSENIQRKDLNVLQEAKAMEYFLLKGWSREDIATKLEVSTGWVQVRATVLQLPYEIQNEIAAGYITQNHIKDIYSLKDRDKMFAAVREIKDQKLKNDKRAVVLKKPEKKVNPAQVKVQQKPELERMNDYLMDLLGPSLSTRLLAWASGNISIVEVLDDVNEQCALKNIPYVPPTWLNI
jgi:ParB family chromosome partitioning protein